MTPSPRPAGEGTAHAVRSALPIAPAAGWLPGRPDVRYAFSGRADGTCSDTVGEGDARANRELLLSRHGLPAPMHVMRQVHGRDVAVLAHDSPHDSPHDGARSLPEVPEADGMVTTLPAATLAVMVADCVGVVLATGPAVAVIHAGREGVVRGVVGATVTAARAAAATRPDGGEAAAVIGPAIGGCCYEVPEGMAREVDAAVPGTASQTTWGTPSLDLPGAVEAQLRAAGMGRIHRAGGCTRCEADRWFSHRAWGEGTHPAGRQVGLVVREAA